MSDRKLKKADVAAFTAWTENPLSLPRLSETHRQHALRVWLAALRYERKRCSKSEG